MHIIQRYFLKSSEKKNMMGILLLAHHKNLNLTANMAENIQFAERADVYFSSYIYIKNEQFKLKGHKK